MQVIRVGGCALISFNGHINTHTSNETTIISSCNSTNSWHQERAHFISRFNNPPTRKKKLFSIEFCWHASSRCASFFDLLTTLDGDQTLQRRCSLGRQQEGEGGNWGISSLLRGPHQMRSKYSNRTITSKYGCNNHLNHSAAPKPLK